MHLDRRFFIVVSISLAWAAVVAGVFYRLASTGRRTHAEAVRSIVVAAKALPAGVMIDRESVKLHPVPESTVPAGSFVKLEDVLDRPVISTIQLDEAVVAARIAPKGSGAGLAPMIPPGMRAVSVRVNDVAGVAGFVLPGMRVDVLFTGHPSGHADTVTRTLLQDIPVLSAGQTTQSDGKNQAIVVPVVTLLVNPTEAELLSLTNGEGRIQLVLRNSTDRKMASTGGHSLQQIFGGTVVEEQEPRPRVAVVRPRGAAAPSIAAPIVAAPISMTAVTAMTPPAPAPPEHDEIIVIHGKVKTLEVFPREGSSR